MAKRRTRALNEADRAVLQNLETNYPGSLAYAEKNGKVDPRVIKFFQEASANTENLESKKGLETQLARYTSLAETVGKKYTQPELEGFLKQTEKEADLTPQELEDRLEAFQEIGAFTKQGGFDKNRLESSISQELTSLGYDKNTADGLTAAVVNQVLAGKKESADTIREAAPGAVTAEDTIRYFNELGNRLGGSEFRTEEPIDTKADVTRIQGQLDAYKTQAEKEGALTSYLNALPAELHGQTDERLRGLYSRAQEGFEQDVKPRLRAGANVRGMLFSGDVQDLEATEAANIQADLESTRAGLEQSDYDFYFNAAYQDTVRKLLDANTNYRSALDTERGRVMTDRATRFQESQDELNRRQSERLTEQDYNLKLQSQRSRMNRDRDIASDKNRNDLINTGLGVVGQVAGTYVGTKIGTPKSTS